MKKLLLLLLCIPLILFSCSNNKVGISITLEMPIKDILVSLSGNNKDTTFRKTLQKAVKNMENSPGKTLVDLFANEFDPEGMELSYIFGTRFLRHKVQGKNNTEVIKVIDWEVTEAIESSVIILQERLANFNFGWGKNANISRTKISNRVIVELPKGLDSSEINRIEMLLRSQSQLEFWETFEFHEVFEDLQNANLHLASKNGFVKDTTDTDSIFLALENPWFAVCGIPQGYQGIGPVIGYTLLKDTSTLNSYINDEEFMSNFDPDIKFAFAFVPGDETKETFFVIALKRKGPNGYVMDGSVISDANSFIDDGQVRISMSMNADGANIWKTTTGSNIGRSVAIVLDGYVKSWPTVNSEIPNGRSEITGNFTVNEGKDLANILKSGKLPAGFDIVQIRKSN